MSHELRTPLNSILGFGQLLQLERLSPNATDCVDRIVNAGRHLLALINEVLEISRIEAGRQPLQVEPVHCCGPLTEAVDLVRPLAAGRDIALEQDLHAGLFGFVLADYQRLKQVLLNVLTNAVKYNRPGGTVRIVLQSMPDGRLRYRFSDTGRGIAPEDIERAFLPFERLDADSTDAEGSGLGLALSKGLIEAMGGAIGIERSARGEGSVFYVDLPLTDNPHDDAGFLFKPEHTPFPRRIERGGRVLYIEDNLANYDLVRKVFDRLGGLDLMSAMQGQIGIELAAEHQPDLILLDLHLPDIDGEEVLRRLRADERTRDIPVIILSADATPAQAERLKARGAEEYLTKPLELAGFVDAVERALGRGAA
jgi:CheY-like chemotaxis protein/anti-sigma regulatory factor (Ser/Thr protein kinase)